MSASRQPPQSLGKRLWAKVIRFCWPYDQLDDDLAPWVEAGKLQWLGAEDDGYPLLRDPASEFPYADMDGLRGRWSIFGKHLKLLPHDMTLQRLQLPSPRRKKAFARLRPIEEQMLKDRDLRILSRRHDDTP